MRSAMFGAITFAIAAIAVKRAMPVLGPCVARALRERCQRMAHDMEFGEEPPCSVCYEMHRAMHRRMEREQPPVAPSE